MSARAGGGLAASVLVGLLLAPAPAGADCRDDLKAVDKSFEKTLERLEKVKDGTPAQKCPVYRQHVEVMTKARGVFQRCNTGTTQRENVGQMNDSIEDFQELIRRTCRR
jgi:hypothetical protein